jgi:polar amino acid transport system permease protein
MEQHTDSRSVVGTQVDDPVKIIKRHSPGRWLAVAVVLVFVAMLVNSLFTNPGFEWSIVWQYLFDQRILSGVAMTLKLTAVSMTLAIMLGVTLALMILSSNNLLFLVARSFVWVFRGTPLLVQLLLWSFIAALYPTLSVGIPFGPAFISFDSNVVITVFIAGVLGLGLNAAAYMAEIVRAGVMSVPKGQFEAAKVVGLSWGKMMHKVVLPQAMRIIVPPTGNQLVQMLKYSSLVSVIALRELLTSAQLIYSRTFEVIPLLLVVCIWYLAITTALNFGQAHLERHFGKGTGEDNTGRLRSIVFWPFRWLRDKTLVDKSKTGKKLVQ